MLGTLPGVVFLEERGCLQDPRSKQALRGLPRGLQPNPEARFHSSLTGEPLTPSRERTLSWSRDDLVQLPWPWNLSRLGVMGNLGDVPCGGDTHPSILGAVETAQRLPDSLFLADVGYPGANLQSGNAGCRLPQHSCLGASPLQSPRNLSGISCWARSTLTLNF